LMRFHTFTLTVVLAITATCPAIAIDLVLDYTLDENNEDWFGGSPEGLARRAAVDTAADFLSTIITNDDWSALPTLNESFSLSDIAASSIQNIDDVTINGSAESDGDGYEYSLSTSNRSSVGANEYIVYVSAFEFDAGTSSHAKGGWDSNDRRNAAGFALTEFNTWGGRIYFDIGEDWYTGLNPGINPSDDYGVQDPDKTPATDISTDNWDWSTSSQSWKGFDTGTIDPTANGKADLYATAIHEFMHALGATSSVIEDYVGVNGSGEFTGLNVVAEYGGPVPGDGGHFDFNTQSTVWNSDGIVSEVVLDPTSTTGDRKYFTDLDAALLRDMGYNVVSSLSVADFNLDTLVDGGDLSIWEAGYGLDASGDANGDGFTNGADLLIWQQEHTGSPGPVSSPTSAVPEPSTWIALLLGMITLQFRRAVSLP